MTNRTKQALIEAALKGAIEAALYQRRLWVKGFITGDEEEREITEIIKAGAEAINSFQGG